MEQSPCSRTSRLLRSHFEGEPARLHREIEQFTKRLESERRLSLVLDEGIRQATQTLEQKLAARKATVGLQSANSRDAEMVNSLEVQLHRARIALGELQIANKAMRAEIDVLRKGNLDCLNSSRRLAVELKEVKDETQEAKQRYCRSVNSCSTMRHRMTTIQEAKVTHFLNSSQRLSSLHREILEDRRQRQEQLQALVDIPQPTELSDDLHLLRHLSKKWHSLLRSKRKEVDRYLHDVSELSRGFKEMMRYSSIDDLQEVVISFLNSLERQREIHMHLVSVSEQTDLTAEKVAEARYYLEALSNSQQSTALGGIATRLKSEIEKVERKQRREGKALETLKQEIQMMEGPMNELIAACEKAGLEPRGADSQDLEGVSAFFLVTAPHHLSVLQSLSDCFTSLLHPESPTAHLSVLPTKVFLKSRELPPALDSDHSAPDEDSVPLSLSQFRLRAKGVVNK